ncbi:MAG: class A beta-lactamase-related serine hydrolase [Bacteroidia bacterium]|nr:class A beta-lactamase-related serine hydrolase [Bacteroidia bacterium]MDW8236496.1 serine hydrolase [Bacteroidia bacterium]
MSVRGFVWLACIFSLAWLPPQPYRPQVNTLYAPDTIWLRKFLYERTPELKPYLDRSDKYQIQILYTQINRDAKNRPILKHYSFRLDTLNYFYPASIVKLPLVALAVEQVEKLKSKGITLHTPFMLEPSDKGCLREVERRAFTLVDCIRRQMVYSDNLTFDYLYALVGPAYATLSLKQRGYTSAYFGHRLARSCSPEENFCVEKVSFLRERKEPYIIPASCLETPLPHPYPKHPNLVSEYANSLSLRDAHAILISLIFPQVVKASQRFQISSEGYHILRRYLSMYPSEAGDFADFPPHEYHDGSRKFFIMGCDTMKPPPRIRIFNKVGLAWGYLIDVAYIVDFELGVEFFLSAVIYVGEGKPGYPPAQGYPWSRGFKFLKDLSWAIYRYETTRRKPYLPNLSAFRYDYHRR